jgi:hypothetical protein
MPFPPRAAKSARTFWQLSAVTLARATLISASRQPLQQPAASLYGTIDNPCKREDIIALIDHVAAAVAAEEAEASDNLCQIVLLRNRTFG